MPVASKKKKVTEKKNSVSSNSSAHYGVERAKDLPWCEKKVILFKILKKLGEATAAEVASASNGKLTNTNVRHYGYHAKAGGLVEVQSYELDKKTGKGGENKYYFRLTAAGKK